MPIYRIIMISWPLKNGDFPQTVNHRIPGSRFKSEPRNAAQRIFHDMGGSPNNWYPPKLVNEGIMQQQNIRIISSLVGGLEHFIFFHILGTLYNPIWLILVPSLLIICSHYLMICHLIFKVTLLLGSTSAPGYAFLQTPQAGIREVRDSSELVSEKPRITWYHL